MTTELLQLAKRVVEPALAEVLDRLGEPLPADEPRHEDGVPDRLRAAMRYALLSPGKRLRPALVLGGARAVHARPEDVLPAACAVEMIHAYSLIHDDLPAMDDDDLRRGQPSCHRKFDEATALLAGDALLTEALGLVAAGRPLSGGEPVPSPRCARAAAELARAAGAGGMVGGQVDDLALERGASADALLSIHRRKTGRLIRVSCELGAIYGGGSEDAVRALSRFGEEIGLAFQLIDDAIDGDGVAAVRGVEAARAEGAEATRRGIRALEDLGAPARDLIDLATSMQERRG